MPDPASDPAVILVRPQMGENIGAAARAMLNFGLTEMRLVAPRDGWPNPKAAAMASGAGAVLDRAQVSETLADAAGDCVYTFATTARPRDMDTPVYTPAEAMDEARTMTARGLRVGLVFGPERAGLENDDVARANAVISVPVNPDFPSLNLAQCVLLLGYEWRRGNVPPFDRPAPDLASMEEVDRLGTHWEERLDAAGFFFPPDKAPHMRRSLRNMWSRLGLTRADVQVLHGALRQLVRRRD